MKGPSDVTKINKKIRGQVRKAKTRPRLMELKRRSRYLITLTHSPSVKKGLKGKVLSTRKRARREYGKTAKLVGKKLGGKK